MGACLDISISLKIGPEVKCCIFVSRQCILQLLCSKVYILFHFCHDDDFIQYVRRKPVRYYIGGFKSTISEQKLANYLLRRGITVSRINIRRYEDQDRSVIQLNVDPEHGPSLQQRGFWPPGVYCRQWYTRNEYRQKTFGDNFPN